MPDTNGNIASANISELDALGETGAPQVQPAKPQFEVGSYVTFGRYPQNNGDTPEPIEWLVLDNDGNTALLLSKYGLDGMPFYDEFINESGVIGWILCEGWHDSQVRQWLNDDFYSRAFNAEEKEHIAESVIYTGDNPKSGNKGGGETRDRVFCLSIDEAVRYFGNLKANDGCAEVWHSEALDSDWRVNRERACTPTAYAILHHAVQGKNEYSKDAYMPTSAPEWWFENCLFWLRSPGEDVGSAALVNSVGGINAAGYVVFSDGCAVRPALRVKLQ